jgi:hypothetical protein
MNKVSLFSALIALLILPSIAIAATTADLVDGPNVNWPSVLTLTTLADGAASQSSQSFSMNVTALPAGGANYRVFKTNSAGNSVFGNPQAMNVGVNTITVNGVSFDRAVKIQFSSDAIVFDALTVNGNDAMPATSTPGIGQPISESGNYFIPTTNNANYAAAVTLTTPAEGASSRDEQELEVNITYLPPGSTYGIYRTTANGGNFTTSSSLIAGSNTITVPSVGFDRTVRILFSNDAIEFDALTVNGTALWPIDTSGVLTNISNQGGVFDSITPEPDDLDPTWLSVATLTTTAEGAASQVAQTLVINVTSLPAGGANYRIYKTLANGDDMGDAQALYLGINTITVNATATAFDRTVKVQFDSDDFEFNTLAVNGQALWPIDTSGNKVTLATSNLFNSTSDASWVTALTTAVRQDGAPSQSAQTVEIYVTALPSGGANYRVYKTNEASQPAFGDEKALYLGYNTITVAAPGNAFDRAVKIQFDSESIEFNALSVNGIDRVIGANVSEAPSVSIDGSTLSWTETDGTTLQYSDDLSSWTSLPSATSPYSPSTSPDRFYRTISDE